MYRIIMTEPAEYDLINIESYISETLQNPSAAMRTVDSIIEVIETLCELPERRPYVNDELLSSLGVRWIQSNNYNVFFEIEEEELYVLRVLYNRADWQYILSE